MTISNKELKTRNLEMVLQDIHPKKIAVAFLGQGYKKFVTPKELESIIISPTEGSNPYAIQQLAKDIGWEKIFFLSKLHAKIYIGEKETLIGSANLSHNGLSDNKGSLQEACVKMPTAKDVLSTYKRLLSKATKEFKNESAKKKALAKLFKVWGKRIDAGLERTKKIITNFKDFKPLANNQFYMGWYEGNENKPNLKNDNSLQSDSLSDWMYLASNESIEEGDWLLCYEVKKNHGSYKYKGGDIYWQYVHHIVKDVTLQAGYPDLAIELKKILPPEPFKISKSFKKAFATIINREEYKAFRQDDKDGTEPFVASSPKLKKLLPQLIADIKNEMT